MEQPIFKMKRVGLVGGRPVDAQYMMRIEERARLMEQACRPPVQRKVSTSSNGAVQLKMFDKINA